MDIYKARKRRATTRPSFLIGSGPHEQADPCFPGILPGCRNLENTAMGDSDDDDLIDDDDEFSSDDDLNFDSEDEEVELRHRSPLELRRQLERRRELSELRRLLDDPFLELD
ncbi:MAG: hypothetical protein H6981_02135 [Gammaproteobacteria bacterium]|nr:hypothetical protein [Gammaproteobacteria bacterium]MCP5135588.1 hypothetical protein [Gammaproteobacteria bacterium]